MGHEVTCLCSETNCFTGSTGSVPYVIIIMDAKQVLLTVQEFTFLHIFSSNLWWFYTVLILSWTFQRALGIQFVCVRGSHGENNREFMSTYRMSHYYMPYFIFRFLDIQTCKNFVRNVPRLPSLRNCNILKNRRSENTPFTPLEDNRGPFDVGLYVGV